MPFSLVLLSVVCYPSPPGARNNAIRPCCNENYDNLYRDLTIQCSRNGQIGAIPNRHHAGGVDLDVRHIIVTLDVIHPHCIGNLRRKHTL